MRKEKTKMRTRQTPCRLRTEYLAELQITNQMLAERYHIQRDSVNVWFRGVQLPPFRVLLELAWELGVNISYLLSLTECSDPMDHEDLKIRLHDIRTKAGLHLVELAQKSGTSIATIRKYDSGEVAKPSLKVVISLANILGVSLEYLLGLSKYRTWMDAAIAKNPFLVLEEGLPVCLETVRGRKTYYLVTNDRYLLDANGRRYHPAELYESGMKVRKVR